MGTIRQFDLKSLVLRGYDTFIESGTLHGDGVDYALSSGFNHVYSIEIDESLANRAKEKYQHDSRVKIIHGDSSSVLQEIISNITSPCVFWLDAHFPGADAGINKYDADWNYETRLPLERELAAIANRNKPDIIVCDDLWIYEEGNYESGSFNAHCKAHNQNITKEQICGKNLDQIYKLFEKTHKITKHYNQQGFVVFTPFK